MPEWQQRVRDEARELSEKLSKLMILLADDDKLAGLSNKAVALLLAQSHAMIFYLDILERRMAGFGG